jgi:hypothetical protein
LLGNVSFLLYCRQCRYYAVALLCTVLAAWWYLRWDGRRRALVWMALASMCLLASNTLNYVALYAVLAADYWLWGRHQRRLARGDWLALALPQVIFAVALFSVWNPLATAHGQAAMAGFNWMDRLTLFWWNWRDLNQCEFGVGGLLLAGAALCADRRQVWLRRGWVALAVYVTVITLLSPQTLRVTTEADVRYLAPLIPLCIAMSVLVLRALRGRAAWLAVPLAALAFGTNWLHGGPLLRAGLQSTVTRYVGELLRPPPDPYRAAAAWLNQHVAEKQSVLVQPDYAVYPLMFHAPKAVYAWQFKDPADPRFRGLDPVHFAGQVPPDYIVAFGPAARQLGPQLRAWEGQGIRYSRVAVLEIFWRDLHRPELFWRTFEPIVKFDVERDAVYVFQRRTSPGSHDGARYDATTRSLRNFSAFSTAARGSRNSLWLEFLRTSRRPNS